MGTVPRIIHGCWFGGALTPLAERCLESWRRFAPGWEVRVHRELPDCAFAREAAAARQWAMASDMARMAVLYAEGGVYFDLDVELIRPFELEGEWVAGERTAKGEVWMNPGSGIALAPHSPVAAAMLDDYARLDFDPKREMMVWINDHLRQAGAGALRQLPPEVFSPVAIDGKLKLTDATLGIHHYAMSWASPRRRILRWMSWHGMRPVIDWLLKVRDAL